MKQTFLQFGDDNFIRAFADGLINELNKNISVGSVIMIQPRHCGRVSELNNQSNLYTLLLRGVSAGKLLQNREIINCISEAINPYLEYEKYSALYKTQNLKFVISDTGRNGIIYTGEDSLNDKPQESFPGKITAFLFRRYKYFEGAGDRGLIFLPCEDIDKNGDRLKDIVLKISSDWGLSEEFLKWVNESNYFLSTLTDRIVLGYPFKETAILEKTMGYTDRLIDVAEPYYRWVIQVPKDLKKKIPFNKLSLRKVIYTDDLTPYRNLKTRIFDELSVCVAMIGLLCGKKNFQDVMDDDILREFVKKLLFWEIVPSIGQTDDSALKYAEEVLERFKNPYIKQQAFKVFFKNGMDPERRLIPSINAHMRKRGNLPVHLIFSLALNIYFCSREQYIENLEIKGDKFLKFCRKMWKHVGKSAKGIRLMSDKVLASKIVLDSNAAKIKGVRRMLTVQLINITRHGPKKSLAKVVKRKNKR